MSVLVNRNIDKLREIMEKHLHIVKSNQSNDSVLKYTFCQVGKLSKSLKDQVGNGLGEMAL